MVMESCLVLKSTRMNNDILCLVTPGEQKELRNRVLHKKKKKKSGTLRFTKQLLQMKCSSNQGIFQGLFVQGENIITIILKCKTTMMKESPATLHLPILNVFTSSKHQTLRLTHQEKAVLYHYFSGTALPIFQPQSAVPLSPSLN